MEQYQEPVLKGLKAKERDYGALELIINTGFVFALRVAKYLKTSPEFRLNWQATYDLQKAHKKHRKEYDKISTVK